MMNAITCGHSHLSIPRLMLRMAHAQILFISVPLNRVYFSRDKVRLGLLPMESHFTPFGILLNAIHLKQLPIFLLVVHVYTTNTRAFPNLALHLVLQTQRRNAEPVRNHEGNRLAPNP